MLRPRPADRLSKLDDSASEYAVEGLSVVDLLAHSTIAACVPVYVL